MYRSLRYTLIPQTYNGLPITTAQDEEGYYARIAFVGSDGLLNIISAGPRTTRERAVELVIARVALAQEGQP